MSKEKTLEEILDDLIANPPTSYKELQKIKLPCGHIPIDKWAQIVRNIRIRGD